MHTHISLPDFVKVAAYMIVFGAFWRIGTAIVVDRNPDSPLGKAMAFVHG